MKRIALIFVSAGVLACGYSAAEMPRAVADDLLTAFTTLAEKEDTRAAGFVMGHLADTELGYADWKGVFEQYFASGDFTATHARFWDYALGEATAGTRERVALISGYWACEAVRADLERGRIGPQGGSYGAGVSWLNRIEPELSTGLRNTLRRATQEVLAKAGATVGNTIRNDEPSPGAVGVGAHDGATRLAGPKGPPRGERVPPVERSRPGILGAAWGPARRKRASRRLAAGQSGSGVERNPARASRVVGDSCRTRSGRGLRRLCDGPSR